MDSRRMRDWLTDEERADKEANAWKLHLEAAIVGVLLLYTVLAALVG